MSTYYVATLVRYVLVEASDESEARRLGDEKLYAQYADVRQRLGRELPIHIHTVRLATHDELNLSGRGYGRVDRKRAIRN